MLALPQASWGRPTLMIRPVLLGLAYSLARFHAELCLVRSRSDAQRRAEVRVLRHQLRSWSASLGNRAGSQATTSANVCRHPKRLAYISSIRCLVVCCTSTTGPREEVTQRDAPQLPVASA